MAIVAINRIHFPASEVYVVEADSREAVLSVFLYNRHLAPHERYRTLQLTGRMAPTYVYFSYRTLEGKAVIDPLCRIEITDHSAHA